MSIDDNTPKRTHTAVSQSTNYGVNQHTGIAVHNSNQILGCCHDMPPAIDPDASLGSHGGMIQVLRKQIRTASATPSLALLETSERPIDYRNSPVTHSTTSVVCPDPASIGAP